MVEDVKKEGWRLVIPARTTGQGLEKIFLAGLEYELGSGFALYPMFVQWVDENVKADWRNSPRLAVPPGSMRRIMPQILKRGYGGNARWGVSRMRIKTRRSAITTRNREVPQS